MRSTSSGESSRSSKLAYSQISHASGVSETLTCVLCLSNCRNYESHQIRLEKINRQNDVKQKKGIIESDYIKMKKQLSKYKNRAGEFSNQRKSSPP